MDMNIEWKKHHGAFHGTYHQNISITRNFLGTPASMHDTINGRLCTIGSYLIAGNIIENKLKKEPQNNQLLLDYAACSYDTAHRGVR